MALQKQKFKSVKCVAQKVKLFRANEPLMSVFMWGINHTVAELSHISVPVMLMPDDFKAYSKVRVDNHLYNKEIMPSHFKFKEYCPNVFRNLRERFSINDIDYMNSLTKQLSERDSPGKSESRMFLSQDKLLFVKTLMAEEVEQMHHIIKQYHQYIVECHAETLLPQYLGMYRITVNDIETYLVVMRNVFSPRLKIHRKYDLKGSTVSRKASDKERAKELPTFKDKDFLKDGVTIYIGQEEKDKLLKVLGNDVEFLSSLHLMDYSLIVGIHERDRIDDDDDDDDEQQVSEEQNGEEHPVEENSIENGVVDADVTAVPTPPESPLTLPFLGEIDPDLELYAIVSSEDAPKREIYFMALIDVLTKYGMKKRTAQAAKTVKHGAGAEISTQKPEQYARRFLEFITKCIERGEFHDEPEESYL